MNWIALILQKCPKCSQGKLFNGILKMPEHCEHCGFKLERQEGYFTSAIFVGNFLYALIVAPTLMIMSANDVSFYKIAVVLVVLSLIFVPLIFRYARTIWLHIDFIIHPD